MSLYADAEKARVNTFAQLRLLLQAETLWRAGESGDGYAIVLEQIDYCEEHLETTRRELVGWALEQWPQPDDLPTVLSWDALVTRFDLMIGTAKRAVSTNDLETANTALQIAVSTINALAMTKKET